MAISRNSQIRTPNAVTIGAPSISHSHQLTARVAAFASHLRPHNSTGALDKIIKKFLHERGYSHFVALIKKSDLNAFIVPEWWKSSTVAYDCERYLKRMLLEEHEWVVEHQAFILQAINHLSLNLEKKPLLTAYQHTEGHSRSSREELKEMVLTAINSGHWIAACLLLNAHSNQPSSFFKEVFSKIDKSQREFLGSAYLFIHNRLIRNILWEILDEKSSASDEQISAVASMADGFVMV